MNVYRYIMIGKQKSVLQTVTACQLSLNFDHFFSTVYFKMDFFTSIHPISTSHKPAELLVNMYW